MLSHSTRFILVNTSHSGNVGAAARAMKVMGFEEPGSLLLVAPRYENVKAKADAIALASGALDVLESAVVHESFEAAIGEVDTLVALTARGRDFGPPAFALRDLCEAQCRKPGRVGFVFGSERYGLPNEIIAKCHAIAHIPANPRYSSLNLAQSLMLVSYEWRQALELAGASAVAVPESPTEEKLATAQAVQGMISHLEEALTELGFHDPEVPKKLLPRLNRLFNRAQVTEQEVHILRGIAKMMLDNKK
jgi:tRNA/rRNA methyltransferase